MKRVVKEMQLEKIFLNKNFLLQTRFALLRTRYKNRKMLKPRLKKYYENVVCEDFILLYDFKNISSLPCIDRLAISSRSRNFNKDSNLVMQSFGGWWLGSTQKCVKTRARNSIALFDIRKDNLLGLKATCRKSTCFVMLDKLLVWVLPQLLANQAKQMQSKASFRDRLEITKENLDSFFKSNLKKHTFSTVQRYCLNDEAITQNSKKLSFKSFFVNSNQINQSKTNKSEQSFVKENHALYNPKRETQPWKGLINSCKENTNFLGDNKNKLLFFTVSHLSSIFLPEIRALALFFNGVSGFSLLCSLKKPNKQKAFSLMEKQFFSAFQFPK